MMRDDPARFDMLLRAITTAALAYIIVLVAAYQVIHTGRLVGPFVNWAGIIIGAYFGAHIASNGAAARKRMQDDVQADHAVERVAQLERATRQPRRKTDPPDEPDHV